VSSISIFAVAPFKFSHQSFIQSAWGRAWQQAHRNKRKAQLNYSALNQRARNSQADHNTNRHETQECSMDTIVLVSYGAPVAFSAPGVRAPEQAWGLGLPPSTFTQQPCMPRLRRSEPPLPARSRPHDLRNRAASARGAVHCSRAQPHTCTGAWQSEVACDPQSTRVQHSHHPAQSATAWLAWPGDARPCSQRAHRIPTGSRPSSSCASA
jgi:hypothetical protein